MNNLIIENEKVIMFGELEEIQLTANQELIENYTKPWPVNQNQKKLCKRLCYWDDTTQEVKAKTQDMLNADIQAVIDREGQKKVLQEMGKILIECAEKNLTFGDFIDMIKNLII